MSNVIDTNLEKMFVHKYYVRLLSADIIGFMTASISIPGSVLINARNSCKGMKHVPAGRIIST